MADENVGNIQQAEYAIGDRVTVVDRNLSGEIVDVREFGGKKTYVVHTEKGNRVVVGARQLAKVLE